MANPKVYPWVLTLTIIFLVSYQAQTLQFSTRLHQQQRFCFFEVFDLNQKFTYVVKAMNEARFAIEVSHVDGKNWKSLQYRESEISTVRIDKLAPVSATYSFCLKSTSEPEGEFKILFASGLEVLELHNLPDATDSDNLEREINWIESQTVSLAERSQNLQQLRRANSLLNGMVGIKMIVFAVLGILVIGSVNLVFYKILKGELKKRKLI